MRLSEEAIDSMSVEKKETGIDPLTGLKDRSVLPYLNRQFSVRNHPWSLVIIDIDHFKLVNDIYGHLTGDEILSQVGQTIKVNLKSNDFALRFGGDEFQTCYVKLNITGVLKLDSLRKGRSRIVETGHAVILGWSVGAGIHYCV